MNISMMSYTFSRQPDHFDLKKMFDLTVELEMSGVDLVSLHGREAKELRQMADGYGVPVVCHTFMADLNHAEKEERRPAVEAARRSIEDAVVLGAPAVMIPTPGRPGVSPEVSRANWIAGLAEVAPFARDAGVYLTVENFPGENSPFVTADNLLEAIRMIPELRITYDNGNAATGEEPGESFRKIAKYAVHAHFKDWLRSGTEQEGFRRMTDGKYYSPALIGEGNIDQRASLKAMLDCGYEGHINIEYEGNTYPPAEAVRKATEYLRKLVEDISAE